MITRLLIIFNQDRRCMIAFSESDRTILFETRLPRLGKPARNENRSYGRILRGGVANRSSKQRDEDHRERNEKAGFFLSYIFAIIFRDV